MGERVKFYTIHCPKCNELQMIMKKKNIEFDVIDDKDTVMSVADENNIKSAPFALIDGVYYDVKKLQEWIKEQH